MSPSATLQSPTLKTLASVLSGLFLAMALLWAGPAVAQDEPTVSIQSQQAEAGQAVDVSVTVTEFDSIGAVDLVVNYDPDVLSLSDSEGLIEGAPRDFSANVSEPGELRINWFDASGENPITLGEGTLLTITFSEFAGGTSEITFGADSELADETAATIDATFEDGVVSGELGTLSAGTISDAELNQTVRVPLSGEGLQNVGSASIELAFDDEALRFEGIANDNSGLDLQADASEGVVTLGGFNTDGTTLDSNFVEVEFTFLGGSSNLSVLSDTEISDVSGNPIESALEDGAVSGDTPTLSFADRNVQPGDTVSIALQASEAQNLGSASVDVTFNAASLSFVGTEEAIDDFNLSASSPEVGVVRIGGFSTSGVDPSDNGGRLVNLRFMVAGGFSSGSQTTLGFDAAQSELSNPSGTAYNASFEGGTVTSIDRQVALGTQALDLTAGDTELQVTEVVAEEGDEIVITTDNGDGAFGDETVVGSREVSSELDGEDRLVEVLGGETEDAAPGDHAAHISTDGTVEGVAATSETAAIYGVAQFDWQDKTVINDTSTVTVDVIEVLYGGNVGPDTLSIDLHSVTNGEVGAFIGVSQEDLAVGEVHEDVAIDVLEPRGPGDDSERVEDVIDETGEFFAMAHLGPAGTDANGDRIPAQQPALATTVEPGTVGDFATIGIGLAVDVTRDFGDASNSENYELVALPGDANVDLAETVSGQQGPNWRAFREVGAINDGDAGLEEYDGSEAFNFREGRAFWVIAQSSLSFQGVVSPSTASAISLQGGWNAISNPLRSDLDWQSIQDANGLDEALWQWGDAGWSQVETFASAQSGEGYYVFNSANIDSLSLTSGSSSSAVASASGKSKTVDLTVRSGDENGSSVTVGIGSEKSIYHAPPAHFSSSKTTLRVLSSNGEDEYARVVRPVDGESATFSLMLRGEENKTATIEANGLGAGGLEGAVLIDESSDRTYNLLQTSTASVPTGDDGKALTLHVGATDKVQEIAAPEKTQLQGNYPNPFSQQTTVELALSEQANVKVQAYNVLGQQVATVADGQMEAGTHNLEWDARSLSSGVYFIRMEAGDVTDTKKITVVR